MKEIAKDLPLAKNYFALINWTRVTKCGSYRTRRCHLIHKKTKIFCGNPEPNLNEITLFIPDLLASSIIFFSILSLPNIYFPLLSLFYSVSPCEVTDSSLETFQKISLLHYQELHKDFQKINFMIITFSFSLT